MEHRQDNLLACILMVAGMAIFSVEDLFLKWTAVALSPGQVLLMTGLAGAVLLGIASEWRGQRIISPYVFRRQVVIRNLSEALSSGLYVAALALIPLSVNAALLQASPLVTTLGAALFLRESVGWRRWSAIGAGFVGVLVILRPGTDGFEWAGLLTVACVIVLAARDIATRGMPGEIGSLQLMTWAYIALVPAGIAMLWFSGTPLVAPDPAQWVMLACALVAGLAGYAAITVALRMGEVSVVMPFRYTRLVFTMAFAIVLAGERPDMLTYAGSALVIASGLYTFWRETRLSRRRTKAFLNR